MPSRILDDEIGRLYRLSLDEFTSARNALAKESGGDGTRVRELKKPSVPAWAVNQLYWRDRPTWDALIAAAENARNVNRAVLAGKSGDVRAANTVHDEAVEAAFKATLLLLAQSGHPVTDATRQSIATTLRALPGDEAAGRLTTSIQPGGFEALTGVTIRAGARKPEAPLKGELAHRETESHASAAAAREATRQKQGEAAAARELKDAEAVVRREEFESARLDRELTRIRASLEKARQVAARANEDLHRAEREANEAAAAARAAVERARKAQEAVAHARKTVEGRR